MADARALKSPRRERGDYSDKSTTYTLSNSESGSIFRWNFATAFNFNLPPVQKSLKGVFFDFQINVAATSGTGHGVSPSANDKIMGGGLTAADDKDVYFATASDAVGNGFRLISDGVDGWHILNINGTISREA